jgi:hypothetical protein
VFGTPSDWRDPSSAEAYVRALWWALLVVSRDEFLRDPNLADAIAPGEPTAWWRIKGREVDDMTAPS